MNDLQIELKTFFFNEKIGKVKFAESNFIIFQKSLMYLYILLHFRGERSSVEITFRQFLS